MNLKDVHWTCVCQRTYEYLRLRHRDLVHGLQAMQSHAEAGAQQDVEQEQIHQ